MDKDTVVKRQPYDILMVVPGLPFDGATYLKKSLGGSESAALFMGRELAVLGHHVVMFTNLPPDQPAVESVIDGVRYVPIDQWQTYASMNPHDILIIQRLPELFRHHTCGRLNVLWQHDMLLGRASDTLKAVMWNVDKIAVLSQYMAEQYAVVSGLSPSQFWVTRNGFDQKSLEDGLALPPAKVPRARKRVVFAARPERGADNALEVFRRVLVEEPEAELVICGYDNTTPETAPLYQALAQQIATFNGSVRWAGCLTKKELFALLHTSSVYLYPTPSVISQSFREISCIMAIECNAAGLPVVTTRSGALPETLGDAGVLIEGNAWEPAYHQLMAEKVVRLLRDDIWWQDRHRAALRQAEKQHWSQIAVEWSEMFDQAFAERTSDRDQLASHFMRQSDIMAVKHLLATTDTGVISDDISVTLRDGYSFLDRQDEEGQYDRIGETTTDVVAQTQHEPRYHFLRQWLTEHQELRTILDWGCAHGSYAIGLSNNLPGRHWTGVDISPVTLSFAKKFADQYAQRRESLEFLTVREIEQHASTLEADVGVAFEVLEHVTDPTSLIDQAERQVRPGGKMILTVPYGPWEYDSYDTYPHRAHVWEFDLHDLRDLFGQKQEVKIGCLSYSLSSSLGAPLGWHIIEYTVNRERATGRIDLDRKCQVQRPRQSLSALLIAGPEAANTIAWCLSSLKHVADEIVIGDTGMLPETRDLVKSYGARVVDVDDPKMVGFDTARNQTLRAVTKSWVLWIDTDERLINDVNLHKYLRHNNFFGYALHQHHFACDTTFRNDIPVRLFRRVVPDTRQLKFIGRIHEHPELELNAGPGPVIVLNDVHIAHIGYLSEQIRRHRFSRNHPLLQMDMRDYPERLLQKHFIMRDNMLLCSYEAQQNGGRVTQEMQQKATETIELYRKYFLGRPTYAESDTLEYYSQACRVLGLGGEVAFMLTTGKTDAPPGEVKRYRYASSDDLAIDLTLRAKDGLRAFENPLW